jgi:hypothetical protein
MKIHPNIRQPKIGDRYLLDERNINKIEIIGEPNNLTWSYQIWQKHEHSYTSSGAKYKLLEMLKNKQAFLVRKVKR